MKTNYQGAIERISVIAGSHPQVHSADNGRELEFDVAKTDLWPRFFMVTVNGPIQGGEGSVELSINLDLILADRLKTDRSNVLDVMNTTHAALTDILAQLNKERLIRLTDSFQLDPLYDFQDTQTAGWRVRVRVYLDQGFNCYM
jgi:hypothetical protein